MKPWCFIWIRLLMLCPATCLLSPLVAQHPTPLADSLAKMLDSVSVPAQRMAILNDLAWEYADYDTDFARSYAEQARTLALTLRDRHQEGLALRALGMAAANEDAMEEAICNYVEAESIFREVRDSAGLLSTLNNVGLVYRRQGQCEEASNVFLQGMKIARVKKATQREGILWYNYFFTLIACHSYEAAFETADSLMAFTVRNKNDFLRAHLLTQLGYLNYREERDSLALKQLLQAKALADTLGNAELISNVLNNLGNVYEGLKDYPKAYEYYMASKEIDEQMPYAQAVDNSYHNIGLVLSHMERYNEAIPYMKRALEQNMEKGNYAFLSETWYALGIAYDKTGKHKESVQAFIKYIEIQDSLFSENVQKSLQEAKEQYESEKIARELADTRLAMQQQQTLNARRMGWLAGGLIAIIAITALVLMAIRRKRLELEKRKVELEYQVLRARMNPHFIFNALNSIQAYFSEREFAQGNEYLGAFGQLMRRVLEHSGKSSISLAEELDTLNLYMQLEQVRLKDKFHYSIDLLEDLDESMIDIPPLILQPFVENAIWHGIAPKANPGTIRVRCSMPADRDDLLRVEITDDGVGLRSAARRNHEKTNTSRGISIIRERLGKRGNVKIEEIVDQHDLVLGTRVLLEIPLADD
ncbi:MAG: tetratricopeptide repeat protein [Bacteroidia bacterium]